MRRVALGLIAAGFAIAVGGALLGFAGWSGQKMAQWDAEVTGQDTYTRLSFPTHNQDFIVREGASSENLLLGPAWVEGSSFPGNIGNMIIAAHRDTHFRMLKDLKKGEPITLERNGERFHYRIAALEIIRATDTTFYKPTNKSVLTLVTCYPFYYLGAAPKRFIVRAELLNPNS